MRDPSLIALIAGFFVALVLAWYLARLAQGRLWIC
jgi:hypothetical protein